MLCINWRRICARVPSIKCIVTRPREPSARRTWASSTAATSAGPKDPHPVDERAAL